MSPELEIKSHKQQVEEERVHTETAMKEMARQILGKSKGRKKIWFDEQCRQLLEERNAARLKVMLE